jgi:peptidoglycan/LPS O-acetylase OafA/YrhL
MGHPGCNGWARGRERECDDRGCRLPRGRSVDGRGDLAKTVGESKRIGQLDGVRTLAIGAVFLHHAFGVKLLWAGVDLFFVLSGFLITGILIGAKGKKLGSYFGHFYERRARRILPPYLMLLVANSLLFGIAWMHRWYLYVFLMNFIVALQVPDPKAFDVLWSLAVEEQFYLIWPRVVFFLSETAIAWTAGGLVLLAPVLRWYFTPFFFTHWPVYTLTPFRMDLLAAGALLAILWRHKRGWIERYGGYGPLFTLGSGVGLVLLGRLPNFSTFANSSEANVWIYELCLIASVGIIVWALSGRYVGVLRWGPMMYLGRISYAIYLIHLLVLMLVGKYVGSGVGPGMLAAGISVGYAAVSWRYFEAPILFWKPRTRVRAEAEADERAITELPG